MSVHNEISDGVFFHTVVQGEVVHLRLPPTIAPALSGLPPASPAFTGRDAELSAVLADLSPGGSGTVLVAAVAGLAGVGKTELAVQAAAWAAREDGWFPGGVLFVDLFGYDPARRMAPEQALDGLLRAVGVPGEHIPPDIQDRSRLLRSALAALARAGRRVLLVLDNAATAEQVEPLLPSDGATTALVTSRHTLALDARLHDLRVLGDGAAVDLLDRVLRQAREADSRITDAPEDARVLARLCAGLPLALRITAALLADAPTRPLTSLVRALTDAHTRLDRLRREDRAVRAAFDLSYQALDAPHARLFRLLPLNPGPDLSTESAAHLIDADPYPTEELLQGLARAHLVEPGQDWGRWRLHDLVRLYAHAHGTAQAEPDAREEARTRLHDHYVTTTDAADSHVRRGGTPSPAFADRAAALDWLETERVNLVALAVADPPLGHPDTTIALAGAMAARFQDWRRADDWFAVATAAVAAARPTGDSRAEAEALDGLGSALRQLRRFEESVDVHTRGIAISRELGDRYCAAPLNNLGLALHEMRRFEESADVLAEAAGLYRASGDRHDEALVLTNLGLAQLALRRFEEAVDTQRQALAVLEELDEGSGRAIALVNLAAALCRVHRFEEAADVGARAAELHHDRGDRYGEALALVNLSVARYSAKQYSEAAGAGRRAAVTFREVGDRSGEAQALVSLCTAVSGLRAFEEAVEAGTEAAALFSDLGDGHREATALIGLGDALRRLNRSEEAVEVFTRALALMRESGDRHGEAGALRGMGSVLSRVGRLEESAEVSGEAAALFREFEDRAGEGRALNSLGLAKERLGLLDEAATAYARAVAAFAEVGDSQGKAVSLSWLGHVLSTAGHTEGAVELMLQAVQLFAEQGDGFREATALMTLGDILSRARLRGEACGVFMRAAELFGELGDPDGEARALRAAAIAHNEGWRPRKAE
ncbi:tetratricopeptide repeat protein [Kitasatospora sp. NPDC097605]|uniref:tetratricopeptide repeat protein n=1 Tax=Kitasatospora sp. NPDC097605 TaxID=3157226 RepID=UPI003325FEE7